MAYALLTHTTAAGQSTTSSAIDTTGATVLVLALVQDYNTAESFSDSAGNSWTPSNARHDASNHGYVRLFWCYNPTTSATHTFTTSAAAVEPALAVAAFSGGITTNPIDGDSGSSNAGTTTIQPGSLTPTQNNELIVTAAIITNILLTVSINASFTITDQFPAAAATNWGVGLAYLVQTSATAINPTWTYSGISPNENACNMITLKGIVTSALYNRGYIFG